MFTRFAVASAAHLLSALPADHQMHIPDGYLSPLSSALLWLLMLPFWAYGSRSLRRQLRNPGAGARNLPLVALFAAFAFVIMMFNVPLPGGTTGHAVGGALAAIILGPEVASLAISIALIIQALLFGDGGILAIGANCFNMAVVLPFVSYGLYRAIAGHSPLPSARRVWGAALGGYAGLTASALCAAVEFGLQPALFHAADGTPLYAPYPLSMAIPAMVLPHLAVASVVEGLLTAAVVRYLQRANLPVLARAAGLQPGRSQGLPGAGPETALSGLGNLAAQPRLRALWVVLAVLVAATPFGLLAPGTAWGEWSGTELARMGLGFVPHGMAQLESLWKAPLSGYQVPALGNAGLAYLLSALIGVAVVGLLAWLLPLALGARPGASRQPSPR